MVAKGNRRCRMTKKVSVKIESSEIINRMLELAKNGVFCRYGDGTSLGT